MKFKKKKEKEKTYINDMIREGMFQMIHIKKGVHEIQLVDLIVHAVFCFIEKD